MPYKEPGGNLFNKPPTADQSWASWEYGYWTTAFAGLVFGTFGLSWRQDTSIKSWAMSEARARGDADGADVKIGESLHKLRFYCQGREGTVMETLMEDDVDE